MRLSRLLVLIAVLACASVNAQASVDEFTSMAKTASRGFFAGHEAASGQIATASTGHAWEKSTAAPEVVSGPRIYPYAQVIEEWTSEGSGPRRLSATYTFADDLVSQTRYSGTAGALTPTTRFIQADGFGSTRWLTDGSGAITDAIDYDAFGNEIGRSGTTPVEHLYRGERFDAGLAMYDLRARLYAPGNGRFLTQDSFVGFSMDPQSLHKYAYAHHDPINNIDPSGHITMTELGVSIGISVGINLAITAFGEDHSPRAFATAATWGVVEGVAFLGAAKLVVKSAAALSGAVKSAYFLRQIRNTFKFVESGTGLIPGFQHLYYRMILRTKIGKVVISSSDNGGQIAGALKHVVGEAAKKSGVAINQEVSEAMIIQELRAIANAFPEGAIVANGMKPYVTVRTEGALWEVAVGVDAQTGLMKIFHLRALEVF